MQSVPWNSISASPLTVRKHKNDLTDWTGDPARSFVFESDADRLHLPLSIYIVGSDPGNPRMSEVFSYVICLADIRSGSRKDDVYKFIIKLKMLYEWMVFYHYVVDYNGKISDIDCY